MNQRPAPRPLGSRYELLDLLGTGAMGEVWRARDRESGKLLAAKLLRAEFALDTDIVTRFIQERSILMGLRHPNIVRVHDLVVEGDRLGIVMDLIEGGDLRGRLRAVGTLGRREAVTATALALDGLAEAHARGVLHRDVKPDNVLLAGDVLTDPASVQLSDFSIARLAQESTVQATGLLGTPGYMPPELFEHGQFSAASDVYAAGVMLYELLGGRTPFSGSGTAHTVGFRHVHSEPPRLPVEDELWHRIATMLSKDPRARLTAAGTAAALRDLPDEVLDGASLPVQKPPATWGPAALTAVRPGAIKMEEQSGDLGVTNINAAPQSSGELAQSGEVRALAPAAADDAALTSVGRPAPEHRSPELTRGAVLEEKPKRRTGWLPWAIGALVLVLVAGPLLWWFVLRGDDEADLGQTTDDGSSGQVVQTDLSDDPLPTGLEVTRTAEYDPAGDRLDVTVTYTAGDAPLTGPFLEVVPPAEDGDQCPGVSWAGARQPSTIVTSTGVAGGCNYSVEVGTIPEHGSVDVEYSIEIDLGDDPDAVDAWLARASETTTATLAGSSVHPDAFPVQRLTDISIDIPSAITTATGPLRVRLLPVWVSGPSGPDQVNPLFDSTIGQSTEMLDKVAGGAQNVRLIDACNQALSITGSNAVSVLRAAPDCQILARVGNFDELESGVFSINGQRS